MGILQKFKILVNKYKYHITTFLGAPALVSILELIGKYNSTEFKATFATLILSLVMLTWLIIELNANKMLMEEEKWQHQQ